MAQKQIILVVVPYSSYGVNGNMTLRLKDGVRYFLAYDAESRLTSVSGTVSASFGYIVVEKPVLG